MTKNRCTRGRRLRRRLPELHNTLYNYPLSKIEPQKYNDRMTLVYQNKSSFVPYIHFHYHHLHTTLHFSRLSHQGTNESEVSTFTPTSIISCKNFSPASSNPGTELVQSFNIVIEEGDDGDHCETISRTV